MLDKRYIDKVAEELKINYGSGINIDWMRLSKDKQIHYFIDDRGFGSSRLNPPAVLVSSFPSRKVQSFITAHEFGHVLLKADDDPEGERTVDYFAQNMTGIGSEIVYLGQLYKIMTQPYRIFNWKLYHLLIDSGVLEELISREEKLKNC